MFIFICAYVRVCMRGVVEGSGRNQYITTRFLYKIYMPRFISVVVQTQGV